MVKMKIGSNIKKFRREAGLSQLELAEKLGVTDRCISSWENDRTEPDMGNIEKMAAAMNCRKSQLLGIPTSATVPDYDKNTMEFIYLISQLSPEQREGVMILLRLLADKTNQ